MGKPAQAVVSACGARARDGSPQRRGPTGGGDGEPFLAGGSYLGNTYRGIAAPNVAAVPARGTGTPPQAVVAAYETPAGDGSSHRCGPTGSGDGEHCLGGGVYLQSARKGC